MEKRHCTPKSTLQPAGCLPRTYAKAVVWLATNVLLPQEIPRLRVLCEWRCTVPYPLRNSMCQDGRFNVFVAGTKCSTCTVRFIYRFCPGILPFCALFCYTQTGRHPHPRHHHHHTRHHRRHTRRHRHHIRHHRHLRLLHLRGSVGAYHHLQQTNGAIKTATMTPHCVRQQCANALLPFLLSDCTLFIKI